MGPPPIGYQATSANLEPMSDSDRQFHSWPDNFEPDWLLDLPEESKRYYDHATFGQSTGEPMLGPPGSGAARCRGCNHPRARHPLNEGCEECSCVWFAAADQIPEPHTRTTPAAPAGQSTGALSYGADVERRRRRAGPPLPWGMQQRPLTISSASDHASLPLKPARPSRASSIPERPCTVCSKELGRRHALLFDHDMGGFAHSRCLRPPALASADRGS